MSSASDAFSHRSSHARRAESAPLRFTWNILIGVIRDPELQLRVLLTIQSCIAQLDDTLPSPRRSKPPFSWSRAVPRDFKRATGALSPLRFVNTFSHRP
jgi:hypothetical protein